MLLLLPDLAPKSVQISETDEEADLVKLEEKIKAEVACFGHMCRPPQSQRPICHARRNCSFCLQRRAIEDWHKNTTPIGVPPKSPVEEVAPEDESDEDDDEGTAVQCFVACSSTTLHMLHVKM